MGKVFVSLYTCRVVALLYRYICDLGENFIRQDDIAAMQLQRSILNPKIFRVYEDIFSHVRDSDAFLNPNDTSQYLMAEFIKAQEMLGHQLVDDWVATHRNPMRGCSVYKIRDL